MQPEGEKQLQSVRLQSKHLPHSLIRYTLLAVLAASALIESTFANQGVLCAFTTSCQYISECVGCWQKGERPACPRQYMLYIPSLGTTSMAPVVALDAITRQS